MHKGSSCHTLVGRVAGREALSWQQGGCWICVSVLFCPQGGRKSILKNIDVAHTCCQWSIHPFSMTTSHALVASRWVVPIKSVFGQSYRITTWRSYQIIAGPHRKTNNHLHSHPLLCWLVFGLWEPGELGESPCSHGVTMQMPEIKAPGLEIRHRWLMKKTMANFQT